MKTPANEDAGIAQRNSASNITRVDFARIARKIRMKNLLFSAFCFLLSAFRISRQPQSIVRRRNQFMTIGTPPARRSCPGGGVFFHNSH
jgi:hypothetical protein